MNSQGLADNLVTALLALESPDEARRFLRDLLTEAEIAEFSRRFEVARLLRLKTPYTTIVTATGLSSRTIARIAKWLNAGMGGYQLILARLDSHHAPPPFTVRG